MTESIDEISEEIAPKESKSRWRLLATFVPVVIVVGAIGIWMTLPSSDPIVELPEELAEIPAAKAPAMVPATDDVAIDVPIASDGSLDNDRNIAGPAYIPPAVDEVVSAIAEPLSTPIVDLMATTEQNEQRSRLLDALNADPEVAFEPVEPEVNSVTDSSTTGQSEDLQYALIPGSVIPSVLLQGINTDLPGIAVAQVSRDVFDSKTGTRLLIPRGSRVFGTYGSETSASDERVLVSWERIDLPNGAAIDLGIVIGADQSGNPGLHDQVHRRTGKALAVTGLTSLITAGLSHAANANDPAVLRETGEGHFVQEPSFGGEASREVAQQYGDIVSQVAQRHLDRGPTLTIRPGYEFVIQIAEEISLKPYIR